MGWIRKNKGLALLLSSLAALSSLSLLIILPFIRISPSFASNQTAFNYLALGDSITHGVGAVVPYPPKYKDYLTSDLGVPMNLTNYGIGGLSSVGLVDIVRNNQTFRVAIKNAKLITLFIGINDFGYGSYYYSQGTCGGSDNQDCLRAVVNNFSINLTSIVSEIKSLNSSLGTSIALSEFYNPFVAQEIQNGTQSVLVPYVTQMNNSIRTIAANNGLGFVNLYTTFNGPSGTEDPIAKGYVLPAPDGVHPSDLGSNVIASQFRTLNNYILTKDTDGDGFINSNEKYLGTDILADCPTSTNHFAYPPDLNNSSRVDVADILLVNQQGYGKDTLSPEWGTKYKRMDFDESGKITVSDILRVVNLYFKSFCN